MLEFLRQLGFDLVELACGEGGEIDCSTREGKGGLVSFRVAIVFGTGDIERELGGLWGLRTCLRLSLAFGRVGSHGEY